MTDNTGTDGAIVITGRANIEMVRLLALRSRLGLEIKGLRFSGRPTMTIIREMGITTKRKKAEGWADLNAYIVANGGPEASKTHG